MTSLLVTLRQDEAEDDDEQDPTEISYVAYEGMWEEDLRHGTGTSISEEETSTPDLLRTTCIVGRAS